MAIPLNVELRPEDGVIVDVGPTRHYVRWTGYGRSAISYCNHCGDSLILELIGPDGTARDLCAGCHVSQDE